jgi:hypothetical protein
MTTTTSRRAILAGAATIPIAAAVTAPALAIDDDDELVELAGEWFKIWNDELDGVLRVLEAAEKAGDGPDLVAAQAAEVAIHDRMSDLLGTIEQIQARSVRGLLAKARVADLMHRTNGKVHSDGPYDAWMVVDDFLALDAGHV